MARMPHIANKMANSVKRTALIGAGLLEVDMTLLALSISPTVQPTSALFTYDTTTSLHRYQTNLIMHHHNYFRTNVN